MTDGLPAADEVPPGSNKDANSPTSSAAERQTPPVAAATSASARAALRRTQLARKRAAAAESIVTGDGVVATKYRARTLVIVYYDSYVQSFFEELVKFVSASRNLMRKAKMAAKVAQIKRMAELEVPDDDDDGPDGNNFVFSGGRIRFEPPQLSPPQTQIDGPVRDPFAGTNGTNGTNGTAPDKKENGQGAPHAKFENGSPDEILKPINPNQLSYARADGNGTGIANNKDLSPSRPKPSTTFRPAMGWSSSFSAYGAGAGRRQPPDVFDELDKGLETVQSMCERAAHQFLRDGDCDDDITKIKERLTETRASAYKELDRRLADDADGALKKLLADGPAKSRAFRPHSMRRDAPLVGAAAAAARLKTSFTGAMTNGTNGTNGTSGMNGSNGSPAVSAGTGMGVNSEAKIGVSGGGDMMLEVDEDNADVDMDKEMPKFQFRSTRAMGPRAAMGS